MTKRICYIHVGPHKTGTTSIQWFLQENGAELLNHGYFVPESETKRGAHRALAEALAGLDVGEHREPLVARSIAAIAETPALTIIISSETLEGLFRNRKNTTAFFNRIQELNLQPNSSSSRATSRNGSIRAMLLGQKLSPVRFVRASRIRIRRISRRQVLRLDQVGRDPRRRTDCSAI